MIVRFVMRLFWLIGAIRAFLGGNSGQVRWNFD